MKKILSTLIATSLFFAISCNDDDQAEPTVSVKFIVDNSTSCNYSGEADPDESIANVSVYRNIDDWNNETNAIFEGNPNANGVINLGVLSDGTFYYDLEYKGESNWFANPAKGNSPNTTFVWNRNNSTPIEVTTQLHYGRDSVWGKYVLKDAFIIDTTGMFPTVDAYPDSCQNDSNYIHFNKDMTVFLSQKGTSSLCNPTAAVKQEELVISNLDCGDIGKNDIAHQSGDNIYGVIATSRETIEVRNGARVYRRFNTGFFENWVMIYEKQ